jgi:hypothetical protein
MPLGPVTWNRAGPGSGGRGGPAPDSNRGCHALHCARVANPPPGQLAPREWFRTTDLAVNSRALYQLSYLGTEKVACRKRVNGPYPEQSAARRAGDPTMNGNSSQPWSERDLWDLRNSLAPPHGSCHRFGAPSR